MNRRDLLALGGRATVGVGVAGVAGLSLSGLSGCATGSAAGFVTGTFPVAGRLSPLVPVRVSPDRIIRTTVGLRPHRPGGFKVEAERVGPKLLVHNYGHGGAGMSLSWGTASLAADLCTEHEARRAAVIGCGVAGLTTARELQRRGFAVTIYARDVPPNTTSNLSWASFTPMSGLVDMGRQTTQWEDQVRRAATIAYRQLQLLVGRGIGVSWVDQYTFTNQDSPGRGGGGSSLLPAELQTGQELLGPGEHPFPSRFARRRPALRIEPSVYLDALVADVLRSDGRIVVRAFDGLEDMAGLTQPVVVNCTGLGARDFVPDTDMEPVKGQLTVLVPQSDVDYITMGGVPGGSAGGFIHMMPRGDGIVLGGTSVRGEWSLDPDETAIARVIAEHAALFGGMRA